MKKRLFALLLALTLLPALPAGATEAEPPAALCVAAPGQPVALDVEELRLLCRRYTEQELESVTFSPLSAQVGDLYYRRGTSTGSRVSTATSYYVDKAPRLSDITFLPSGRVTGETDLAVTLRSVKGERVEGVLTLSVPGPDADLTLDSAQAAPMSVTLLSQLCREKTGASLRLLHFEGAPAGALTYQSTGTERLAVNENMVFYVDAGEGRALSRVSYLPDGLSRHSYLTVVGTSTAGESFTARVKVLCPQGRMGTVISFVPAGRAVAPQLSATGLTQITLTLPTSDVGGLWLDHGAYNVRKVRPGETLAAQDFSRLSFLPAGEERQLVQLSYTGTNGAGEETQGVWAICAGGFEDLAGWGWADGAARDLALAGAAPQDWLSGQFRPGESASRMEVIYALVRMAYGFNVTAADPDFSDLPEDLDLRQAVAVAAGRDIVLGDGSGRFNPNDPVARQDVLVMLYRAMTDRGYKLPQAGSLEAFTDVEDLADYAAEAAGVLCAAGILQGGDGGRLDPRGEITRAEMAVLLDRAFGK